MKRIPTIHIREDALRLILDELMECDTQGLVEQIMLKSKQLSVTNRSITITNEKLLKKVQTVNTASRDTTSKFANILYNVRRQRNRFIKATLPKPGTNDYNMQKEAAKDAALFCERFNLGDREGIITYCNMGLDRMKNFAYYKFKNLYDGICRAYEAQLIIDKDPDPEMSMKVYNYYVTQVAKMTGIALFDYKNIPEKYMYFVQMTIDANRIGIPPRVYLDAQFAAFEIRGRYPEPEQLVGEKAMPRIQQYMAENDIKIHNGKKSNRNTK